MIIPLPKKANAQSSSQHWYTMDGNACHRQSDGKPTTLRHARKQNLVPSVSGILGMIEKPQLTKWKADMMVRKCIENPYKPGEAEQDYIDRMHGFAKQDKNEILGFGTRVHNAIEMWNLGKYDEAEDPEIFPYLDTYIRWAQKNLKRVIAAEKTVVNKKLGYGGTIDLIAEVNGVRGVCLIDYKTQRWNAEKKPSFHDSWVWQLAAYRKTMRPNPNCISLVISATDPRPVIEKRWSPSELQAAWRLFCAANTIWQESKKYTPNHEFNQPSNN